MDTTTTPPICPEGIISTPTPTNLNSKDIIGVSRSGRLRMKSSKLLGFQSPDDIETSITTPQANPLNKLATTALSGISATTLSTITTPIIKKQGRGRPPKSASLKKKKFSKSKENYFLTSPSNHSKYDDDLVIDDADLEKTLNELENDDDIDTSISDDVGIDPTIKQSLYMSEKSNKKKILKDGKIVYSKAHRKDKGKSRYTAFMLWAKDTKTSFSNKNFDADIYRLREMWSNVSQAEKLVWKRKAKKLKIGLSGKEVNTPKSTFLNRSSSSRTKKIFENSAKLSTAQIAQKSNQEKRTNKRIKSTTKSPSPIKNRKMHVSLPIDDSKNSVNRLPSPIRNHKRNQCKINNTGIFKVTGQEPLDVAAHLNLLGENLSTIGKKLKEHEGQITVSGSLSVLLDSLLCSLGPLMCLTTNIPKLGTARDKDLRTNLQDTLNNIAYIMPGL